MHFFSATFSYLANYFLRVTDMYKETQKGQQAYQTRAPAISKPKGKSW
jgi:hypothetical protein